MMEHKAQFDSITDWLNACNAPTDARERTSRETYHDSWFGTKTYEDAVNLAKYGWSEGADKARAMASKMQADVETTYQHKVRQIKLVKHGGRIVIGRALEGLPDQYVKVIKHTNPRFVRMVISGFISAGVNQDTIITRGVIAAAVIDALELRNYRVQVELVYAVSGGLSSQSETTVILKRFNEPLDLDRLVFFTAHPSHFRRLWFSYGETQSREFRNTFGTEGGFYGRPADPKDTGDIFLKSLSFADKDWTDPQTALKYCLETLRQKGIEVTE